MRILHGLWIFTLAACHPDEIGNPSTLRDQSGAEFDWACTEQGCKVSPMGDTPPLPPCESPDEPAAYSYSWGRFFLIEGVCVINKGGVAWSSRGGWGRLAVCESDDDCPQLLHYGDEFECRSGFCQSTDYATFPPDALPDAFSMLELCSGEQPRYEQEGRPSELRAAVDAACPTREYNVPCAAIPEGCPDPR